jgi:acyl carrier protein
VLERTETATIDRVTKVVAELLAKHGFGRSIGPEDDLRHAGLSSADMLNLMLTIEDEFGITIPEREMRPANFRSISSIAALAGALLQSA